MHPSRDPQRRLGPELGPPQQQQAQLSTLSPRRVFRDATQHPRALSSIVQQPDEVHLDESRVPQQRLNHPRLTIAQERGNQRARHAAGEVDALTETQIPDAVAEQAFGLPPDPRVRGGARGDVAPVLPEQEVQQLVGQGCRGVPVTDHPAAELVVAHPVPVVPDLLENVGRDRRVAQQQQQFRRPQFGVFQGFREPRGRGGGQPTPKLFLRGRPRRWNVAVIRDAHALQIYSRWTS